VPLCSGRELEPAAVEIHRPATGARELAAVEEHLLLAAALDVHTSDYRLAYAPLASELDAARAWLTRHARAGAAPLIGFQVSSFPTKAYRDWPLEHFTELAG